MSNVADAIIRKCGGHQVVADICGVHVTRVYRWTYPREKGGSDGAIPTRHQAQLLKGARDRGISLTPVDFFPCEDGAASTTPTADAAA